MNKETILALLKSLTNPEVEKHLSVDSVIDYERLFKVLAPFLITILEDTVPAFDVYGPAAPRTPIRTFRGMPTRCIP